MLCDSRGMRYTTFRYFRIFKKKKSPNYLRSLLPFFCPLSSLEYTRTLRPLSFQCKSPGPPSMVAPRAPLVMMRTVRWSSLLTCHYSLLLPKLWHVAGSTWSGDPVSATMKPVCPSPLTISFSIFYFFILIVKSIT